jgi:hypothetical protein
MYQHHPLQELSKFTQNGIFGFKICHLATLVPRNHHWQKQKNKKEKNSGSGVVRISVFWPMVFTVAGLLVESTVIRLLTVLLQQVSLDRGHCNHFL